MSRLRVADQRAAVLPVAAACADLTRNMLLPPDVRKAARAAGRSLLEVTSSYRVTVAAPEDVKRALQFTELHEEPA